MKIRDLRDSHALTFPPPWAGPLGPGSRIPIGYVGVLRAVEWIDDEEVIRLTMEWEGTHYMGPLRANNPKTVLPKVYGILAANIGRSIEEIAELDVPGVTEGERRG